MVVHLSGAHGDTTVVKKALRHSSQMDFLESFVSSHSGLDQATHLLQHEAGHEWKPFHGASPFLPGLQGPVRFPAVLVLLCGGQPSRDLCRYLS